MSGYEFIMSEGIRKETIEKGVVVACDYDDHPKNVHVLDVLYDGTIKATIKFSDEFGSVLSAYVSNINGEIGRKVRIIMANRCSHIDNDIFRFDFPESQLNWVMTDIKKLLKSL